MFAVLEDFTQCFILYNALLFGTLKFCHIFVIKALVLNIWSLQLWMIWKLFCQCSSLKVKKVNGVYHGWFY